MTTRVCSACTSLHCTAATCECADVVRRILAGQSVQGVLPASAEGT